MKCTRALITLAGAVALSTAFAAAPGSAATLQHAGAIGQESVVRSDLPNESRRSEVLQFADRKFSPADTRIYRPSMKNWKKPESKYKGPKKCRVGRYWDQEKNRAVYYQICHPL